MNQDPKLSMYRFYLEADGGEYDKNWIYEILKEIIIIELAVSSCTNLSKSEIES